MWVGGLEDHLFQPDVAAIVRVDHASLIHFTEEGFQHSLRCLGVARIPGGLVGAEQERQPLALGQPRVPPGSEEGLVLPFEAVGPHVQTGLVGLEIGEQPLAGAKKFFPAQFLSRAQPEVVIAEPPLRDRDRVVLETDVAAVVEHGHARLVVGTGIVGLLAEELPILSRASRPPPLR